MVWTGRAEGDRGAGARAEGNNVNAEGKGDGMVTYSDLRPSCKVFSGDVYRSRNEKCVRW